MVSTISGFHVGVDVIGVVVIGVGVWFIIRTGRSHSKAVSVFMRKRETNDMSDVAEAIVNLYISVDISQIWIVFVVGGALVSVADGVEGGTANIT